MTHVIYIQDPETTDYVELQAFLSTIDEKRRKQLLRLGNLLRENKKLEGPNVDYMGESIWRVKVSNEKNYFETFLLRLGEEIRRKIADFRDSYTGISNLKDLPIMIEDPLHPIHRPWSPYDPGMMTTPNAHPIEDFFRLNSFTTAETKFFFETLDKLFRRERVPGVTEHSPISYSFKLQLPTGRRTSGVIRII